MESQRVAAFGCPCPGRGFAGKGDLLEAKTRLVANHGPSTALAFQAVAHGDARWFALDCELKLSAAAGGASRIHEIASPLVRAKCRPDGQKMHEEDAAI